jgi:hypothetical protein
MTAASTASIAQRNVWPRLTTLARFAACRLYYALSGGPRATAARSGSLFKTINLLECSMTIPIYDLTVASFSHGLQALAAQLDKAKAHAAAANYDSNVLASARLYPDMFAFARQVQLATDFAKGAVARLSGQEPPKWADSETTLDELKTRLAKALDYLATFTPEMFDGAESRTIELKTPTRAFSFNGHDFVLRWAIPNFHFHCTTAYNLLRHNGVPVGKLDYLAVES